jgi:hypothetical protein
MSKLVLSGLCGLVVAVALGVAQQASAAGFTGSTSTDFLVPSNWDTNAVPGLGNQAVIANNLTSDYNSSDNTVVSSLIVGADYPAQDGDFGTPGTLNINDGQITVAGGGNAFQIGRACCSGTGIINLTGDAVLEIQGSDPIVGTRDRGELHVGPNASVISTRPGGGYWRLGNYGPAIDAGLQGSGLLDVEGSFSAHVIFLGDDDSSGELVVRGNGSVTLTDNLVPNINGHRPNRSALVHMVGSNASLSALNLESFNGATQVQNKFQFTADAGGVSPITLSNAVNVGNNSLTVDLSAYSLASMSSLLLFDAAPNQIYGDGTNYFTTVNVLGVANPAEYKVVYDLPAGDISLTRVPEPATALMVVFGIAGAVCMRRRAGQ